MSKWLVLVLILAGCGAGGSGSPDQPPITQIFLSDRVVEGAEADSLLNAWLDQRIFEWEKANGRKAPTFGIYIYDHWGFQCIDSPTGWCAGLADPRIDFIWACVYHRKDFWFTPTELELIGTAPHTLISSDEIYSRTRNEIWKGLNQWYVGYIPQGSIGLPVIGHELNHLI